MARCQQLALPGEEMGWLVYVLYDGLMRGVLLSSLCAFLSSVY